MENQTRFDLNAAIQNWQQELGTQSNLTDETRRELETHVRDTVTELQRRGLNDEESFWLARRRTGQPNEIGEEFAKADRTKIYRERVLWIAVAFYAWGLWGAFTSLLQWAIFPRTLLEGSVTSLVIPVLFHLPMVWFVVSVARGRAMPMFKVWRLLIHSRTRFLVVSCFLFLAIPSGRFFFEVANTPLRWNFVLNSGGWGFFIVFLSPMLWPLMLIACILWLLPATESGTFKSVF